MTRHLFILNPAAGRQDKTALLSQMIENIMISEPYDIFVTSAAFDAEKECLRYLNEHKDDFVRIYACGGDGTLSEVANGVYASGHKNCAIGVVPVGSGNDFVKCFNGPSDRFTNLRALTKGEIIDVDLLKAEDDKGKTRVSLNIISPGFDAAVAKGQQNFKKLPLVNGSAAYNMSLVKCLFSSLKNYFTVYVDGVPFGNEKNGPYLFAIAANGKYYGGGFKAAPFSDIRDGLLDLIRIDTVSRLRFLKLVGKFRKGEYICEYEDIVSFTRCKEMQIVSQKPIDLNLDGEIYPMQNPKVMILPKAINLIMPQNEE
jgi:YegS/Rv2252/BmrU family lipid kinase